jgi:UTP--glucose-1-phosphate uridylyltransferase
MKPMTALIPAAGRGTRLMPLTASIPKELMPLGAYPALHYIMSELGASQLQRTIVVSNSEKSAIAHYLDTYESQFHIAYAHQSVPRGLGHAVLQAHHLLTRNDSFILCLPDDIITGTIPASQHLITMAHTYGYSMAIMVQAICPEHTTSYGIIGIDHQLAPGIFKVKSLVEKPTPAQAPSAYAIVGRYLLTYEIFEYLHARTANHAGPQEIQLTHALHDMLTAGHKILAVVVPGTRYDIGTIPGWLHANLELSLHDPHLAPLVQQYIVQHSATWATATARPSAPMPGI